MPPEGDKPIVSESAPATGLRRVLIVDDNANVRQFLADYVRMMHREVAVLTAASGLEAVSIAKDQRPDLALVDLNMPGFGGCETARQLQQVDPRIRIVLISGAVTEETRREAERLGVGLLVKPFDMRTLQSVFQPVS